MENLINSWIVSNWKRKVVAIFAALIVWIFVNQSISSSVTLTGIPIRIVNLPPEKTIEGLLPNGVLNRRLTLTINGTKQIVDNLEPSDLEVVLDAMHAPDEWVVQIGKKNLVGLNPNIDINHHISLIKHPELVLKFSKVITAKIPIILQASASQLPKEYQFLGVWPQNLTQTVIGPEEQVQQLRAKGLEVTFDLSEISKAELDALRSSQEGFYEDEVSYIVPDRWKKVAIPFLNNALQPMNDPEASELRIDFLRKEFISLEGGIPIQVFFPLNSIQDLNPLSFTLAPSPGIESKKGILVLTTPLLVYEVSRLFLDIVRDYFEITITALQKTDKKSLSWCVSIINPQSLENQYVNFLASRHHSTGNSLGTNTKQREELWRIRFREYMQKLTLYKSKSEKFTLETQMEEK